MRRFCDVLKARRKEKGLTLEKVAKAVGTHKGYISGIENDQVGPPRPTMVGKLAKVLELDVDELLVLRLLEHRGRELTVRKIFEVTTRLLEEEAKRISDIAGGEARREVEARDPAAARA